MALTQGQFTIIDYNDALSAICFINSNLARTQAYTQDADTYTPDFVTTHMVLKPEAYIIGSTTNIIKNVTNGKWYAGSTWITSSTDGYVLGNAASEWTLTITKNILTGAGQDYIFEGDYLDDTTGLTIKIKASMSLSLVKNGTGIADLVVLTPNGYTFKNAAQTDYLTAKAEWRGEIDGTKAYQWQVYTNGAWTNISNATGKYAGATTDTLTIYSAVVNSYAIIRCKCTVTKDGSSTDYYDTCNFIDLSDPLQLVIDSSAGGVFKNSTGSTTLHAILYQNGTVIDPWVSGKAETAYIYKYTWHIRDKDGNAGTFHDGTSSKTGKKIDVTHEDVDVKAVFVCEVEKR